MTDATHIATTQIRSRSDCVCAYRTRRASSIDETGSLAFFASPAGFVGVVVLIPIIPFAMETARRWGHPTDERPLAS
jgi:hypothetical protein